MLHQLNEGFILFRAVCISFVLDRARPLSEDDQIATEQFVFRGDRSLGEVG